MRSFSTNSVIVDELARCKAALLHRSDDTNHHIRLLLHERQMLFSWMLETQKALYRLNCAFDPLSVASTKDGQDKSDSTKSAGSWKRTECMSILGLAELNLNTGQNLQERLLGSKLECPKNVMENLKSPEELVKQQLDTPAEEGLRQVNEIRGW